MEAQIETTHLLHHKSKVRCLIFMPFVSIGWAFHDSRHMLRCLNMYSVVAESGNQVIAVDMEQVYQQRIKRLESKLAQTTESNTKLNLDLQLQRKQHETEVAKLQTEIGAEVKQLKNRQDEVWLPTFVPPMNSHTPKWTSSQH